MVLQGRETKNKSSILELISIVPGIHLREVARALGVSLNTVRYHVKVLSDSGLISCSNEGGYFRLYPVGTPEDLRSLYAILRNRTSRRILGVLAKENELSNKEICELTGLAKSTVSEHVQVFLQNHLVIIQVSQEYGPKIRLVEKDLMRGVILSQTVRRIDPVQNYLDLWDF